MYQLFIAVQNHFNLFAFYAEKIERLNIYYDRLPLFLVGFFLKILQQLVIGEKFWLKYREVNAPVCNSILWLQTEDCYSYLHCTFISKPKATFLTTTIKILHMYCYTLMQKKSFLLFFFLLKLSLLLFLFCIYLINFP